MKLFRKKSVAPKRGYEVVTQPPSWLRLYEGGSSTYGAVFRASPSLQAVVRVLSENAAELPQHAYASNAEKLGPKSPLARILRRPNPQDDRFTFRRDLFSDLCVYGNSYHVAVLGRDLMPADGKLPDEQPQHLVRIPPERVAIVDVADDATFAYEIQFTSGAKRFPASRVLHVKSYNPGAERHGVSKVEALKGVLAEERALIEWRGNFWRNAARPGGIISRPLDAPELSDEAFERFRSSFKEAYTGTANSGSAIILEEGMTWKPDSFSPRDSQFTEALSQIVEMVAHVYGVPFGLVGGGSQRNLQQNRRSLMQDAVLPSARLVDEAMNRQLVPLFYGDAADNFYVKTDASDFVQGDLSMLVDTLSEAVRNALLTPNECRELLGRGPVARGDDIYMAANYVPTGQGGQ